MTTRFIGRSEFQKTVTFWFEHEFIHRILIIFPFPFEFFVRGCGYEVNLLTLQFNQLEQHANVSA